MTHKAYFNSILSKQVPDEIQRKKAHYVINTDFPGYCESRSQLAQIIEDVIQKNEEKWKIWLQFERIPLFLSTQSTTENLLNRNNLNTIESDIIKTTTTSTTTTTTTTYTTNPTKDKNQD